MRILILFLLFLFAGCNRLPPPVFPDDDWEEIDAEELGFESRGKLEKKLKKLGKRAGSIFVVRRGYFAAKRGDVDDRERLYSVSKSLSALLYARASELGKVELDELVEGSDQPEPPGATWRQFLSMTSDFGLKPHEPGKHFAYNNRAVHFYATKLQELLHPGASPAEALRAAYLDVIGIEDGIDFRGLWSGWNGGFAMSARDLARVGLLVLREGRWENQSLLDARFIESLYRNQVPEEAKKHRQRSRQFNEREFTRELEESYSFGWWIGEPDDEISPWIYAFGRGGNFIIVHRKRGIVIGVTNDAPGRHPNAEEYLDAVEEALDE